MLAEAKEEPMIHDPEESTKVLCPKCGTLCEESELADGACNDCRRASTSSAWRARSEEVLEKMKALLAGLPRSRFALVAVGITKSGIERTALPIEDLPEVTKAFKVEGTLKEPAPEDGIGTLYRVLIVVFVQDTKRPWIEPENFVAASAMGVHLERKQGAFRARIGQA